MTPEAFSQWIELYTRTTGAGPAVADTLRANYRAIVQQWRATLRELDEVATRFVVSGRIPKWPDEHLRGIGAELDALRAEDAAKRRRPARDPEVCTLCRGTGYVSVPHPCCIWKGEIRPYYNPRTKVRKRAVLTVAVLCCCSAGEAAKQANRKYAEERHRPPLRTIESYTRLIGGCDGVAILREWESRLAEASRRAEPRGDREQDLFRRVLANIQARDNEAEEYEEDAVPV